MVTIDPAGDILQQLEDSVVVIAHESQSAFAERYAGLSWRVDLASSPAAFWFEREPEARFRAGFIGSVSGQSNTWLWGWENVNGFPAVAVSLAAAVREFGERTGVPLLTTAKLDLGEQGDALVHSLLRAAMALSDIYTYYRPPTSPGSYAWLLVDNPEEFALAAPSPVVIARTLTELLGAGLLGRPRTALAGYAERRDGVELVEEPGAVVLRMAAGALTVRFDDADRITKLEARVDN